MIEIIREEGADGTTEKRGLPKDIRQIGNTDIGDRIYLENQIYQYLHSYRNSEEKRAYVLLGRFENYAGRECVFVEAALKLEDLVFEGDMPLWSDQTWAYIYRQLRQEYDNMVIVGWALDIRGQLPSMAERLSDLHRHNFGGTHQVLFLIDSLEGEEVFYGSRGGQLYRREGFYIYYEKGRAKMDAAEFALDSKESETGRTDWKPDIPDAGQTDLSAAESEKIRPDWGVEKQNAGWEAEKQETESSKPESEDLEAGWSGTEQESLETAWSRVESENLGTDWRGKRREMEEHGRRSFRRRERETGRTKWRVEHFLTGREAGNRGSYRKQLNEQEEHAPRASYASTFLLAVVVCALGVTAYLNGEKMAAMEETLARMNGGNVTAEVQQETERAQSQNQKVAVENIEGSVSKQENDTAGMEQTNQPQGETQTSQVDGAEETGTVVSDATGENAVNADASNVAADAGAAEAMPPEQTSAGTDSENQVSAESTSTGTVEDAALTEAQTYLKQGYYVVQKGDSIMGICRKIYQTTAMADKLCEVNGIENADSIYAGQYLKLPN